MTPEQKEKYRKQQKERYHSDPEFRKRRISSNVEYLRNRYQNDPEFREQEKKRNRDRYKNNPEFRMRRRRASWKDKGIDPGQAQLALEANNGSCDLCGKAEIRLDVDHCHKTGKVRGVLCHLCNKALGQFGDNIEGMQRALDYLKK